MSVMRSIRVRPSRSRRREHRALRIHRQLTEELAFEGLRDLLLGRALRRLCDRAAFKSLGFVKWRYYVAERLGCEQRWAQYLVRLDKVCEKRPLLRAALASGRLTPYKVIHLSRILDSSLSMEEEAKAIDAAALLSVRELEDLARRKPKAADASDGTSGTEVPDPWADKKGAWIDFAGSPRVFLLFRAAIEAVRRFAGEELPIETCLEYMAADRLSAVGAPPDLDRPRATPSEQAETPVSASNAPRAAAPEDPLAPPSARSTVIIDVPEVEIPDELNADLVQKPKELDLIVQRLEARDRGFRLRVGKLLNALQRLGGHKLLGYETFNEYCRDGIDLDPRRASRLLRFDRGLRRYPEIATACRAGKLRYVQALLLLRVVTRKTVAQWVEYAVGASAEHTRRAVEDALLGGTTCAPGTDSDGGPLPPKPGDPSPGGHPLRIRYRMFLEEDVGRVVLAALRSYVDPSGQPLPMAEALECLCVDFLENLNDPELDALRARFPILERDDWRCTIVVCGERPHLHEHHIILVIQGGTDSHANQTSLCYVHHIICLHGLLKSIVITGTAPDDITQMIGIDRDGGPPLLVFRGNRKVSSATGDMPAETAPWKRMPMKATQRPRRPAPALTLVSMDAIA